MAWLQLDALKMVIIYCVNRVLLDILRGVEIWRMQKWRLLNWIISTDLLNQNV